MIIQKTETGNIAADAVAACLAHFRAQQRKVRVIYLDALWWMMFKEFMLEKTEGQLRFDDAVQFNNVAVMKGSRLQRKRLVYTLYPAGQVLNEAKA